MQYIEENNSIHPMNWRFITSMIGLLFSCINATTLTIWMLLNFLNVFLKQDVKTAVYFLIFLQVRSLLNPGIAIDISTAATIKWVCILGTSMILIINTWKDLDPNVKMLQQLFLLFGAYLSITGFFVSSYPFVVIFKTVSYLLPCIAIIGGISITPEEKWIHTINVVLGIVTVGSIIIYRLPVAYLRNGISFQGFYNHPNILGVMTAIFIAGLLYEYNLQRKSMMYWAMIAVCAFMIYHSYSRTGMFSFLFVLFVGILSSKTNASNKVILLIVIGILVALLLTYNKTWKTVIINFIYKGGRSIYDITASRMDQITNNLKRFRINPLFGTGFNVPYVEGVRSYDLSFNLITENGNLVLAILGDMGIEGAILFLLCYGRIFSLGKGNPYGYTIYFAPFIVCMGEMAFFSTNNFGMILYMYFAIFLTDGLINREEIDENEEDSLYHQHSLSL